MVAASSTQYEPPCCCSAGLLVAVRRRADYVERRSDGYLEPEEVVVVGTAHVSLESARDVEAVIDVLRPESVVVELCRGRSPLMYIDDEDPAGPGPGSLRNPLLLGGRDFREALQRALALGSGGALVLRFLLGLLSQSVSQRLDVLPGVDMQAARRAAERHGSQLVLGDRPLEISLDRAWTSLSWQQRAELLRGLAIAWQQSRSSALGPEVVDRLREEGDVVSVLEGLAPQFPGVVDALLFERDLYLAWSCKRSKAVNGSRRVVAVVGKGHLRGITYTLLTDRGELRWVQGGASR